MRTRVRVSGAIPSGRISRASRNTSIRKSRHGFSSSPSTYPTERRSRIALGDRDDASTVLGFSARFFLQGFALSADRVLRALSQFQGFLFLFAEVAGRLARGRRRVHRILGIRRLLHDNWVSSQASLASMVMSALSNLETGHPSFAFLAISWNLLSSRFGTDA